MDKSLESRIRMQEEAKAAVRSAKYNSAILVTVGGGKGKIMIDLAMELVEKYKIKRILYLCDSQRLRDSEKDGFPAEIEKWGNPQLNKMITRVCYQAAYKWVGKDYDLVLADEVDVAISPKLVRVFLNNNFRFKILVSGTLAEKKKITLQQIAPVVYRFSTSDAEDKGVVNKTKYYVYNYKMTDEESAKYKNFNKKMSFILADAGGKKGQLDKHSAEELKYVTLARKQYLANLDSSYIHTRRVLASIYGKRPDSRVIVFSELTRQADRVCKHSYHGGNEKIDNLKKFQDGEINALSVVSKIKRGINLKNANVAIFEALSSSSTEFEQRNGRMKRLKTSDIAVVIFMIPWYKTKDSDGNVVWKETVVKKHMLSATNNLRNFDLKTLKL